MGEGIVRYAMRDAGRNGSDNRDTRPEDASEMTPSQTLIECLKKRMLPDGGFAFFNGGSYRTDATAWAIIGLRSAGENGNPIEPGLNRLAGDQMRDGRVVASPDAPDASWVTSLAILAWHSSERHKENMDRAVEFLSSTSGKHWEKQKLAPVAHDTSIRGWSWTADAHSWVAPTSYSLLALRAVGKVRHPRAEEAARMLMNRQLVTGDGTTGTPPCTDANYTLNRTRQGWPSPHCVLM